MGALRKVVMRMHPMRICAHMRCASIRWAPPVPSVALFLRMSTWKKRREVSRHGRFARRGGGLGELFDGAAERGRLASNANVRIRDRPSEHSVEKFSEPDDQSNDGLRDSCVPLW